MWTAGLQHILTHNIAVGMNFEQSYVPVAKSLIDRKKRTVMVRHDISKETSARFSYTYVTRKCETNPRFAGTDNEFSFKLTKKPK